MLDLDVNLNINATMDVDVVGNRRAAAIHVDEWLGSPRLNFRVNDNVDGGVDVHVHVEDNVLN